MGVLQASCEDPEGKGGADLVQSPVTGNAWMHTPLLSTCKVLVLCHLSFSNKRTELQHAPSSLRNPVTHLNLPCSLPCEGHCLHPTPGEGITQQVK